MAEQITFCFENPVKIKEFRPKSTKTTLCQSDTTGDLKIRTPPLRVDPDPNLPEFCSFLLLAEFYLLTVLIFWFKSSEFCSFLLLENR